MMTKDDGGLAIVRIKPLGAGGGGVEKSSTGYLDGEAAIRYDSCEGITVKHASGEKLYTYPKHIIPPSVNNEALYDQFLPQRIDAFFNGINVNIMAYGQTGTGKTHTMFGPPGIMERAGKGQYNGIEIEDTYGIFPRSLIHIFHRAKEDNNCILTCSAVELSMFGNKCGRVCTLLFTLFFLFFLFFFGCDAAFGKFKFVLPSSTAAASYTLAASSAVSYVPRFLSLLCVCLSVARYRLLPVNLTPQ